MKLCKAFCVAALSNKEPSGCQQARATGKSGESCYGDVQGPRKYQQGSKISKMNGIPNKVFIGLYRVVPCAYIYTAERVKLPDVDKYCRREATTPHYQTDFVTRKDWINQTFQSRTDDTRYQLHFISNFFWCALTNPKLSEALEKPTFAHAQPKAIDALSSIFRHFCPHIRSLPFGSSLEIYNRPGQVAVATYFAPKAFIVARLPKLRKP